MKNRNSPISEVLRCKKPFSLILPVLLLALVTAIANANLVAHYEFEGNANDSVGGVVGTLKGNAQIINDPEMGLVLSLDGDADYVDCGATFASVTASTTKSIMAWAKSYTTDYPDGATFGGRIITLYRESGYSGFTIYGAGNPAAWKGLYATAGNWYAYLDSGVSVTANVWTHVALVQDGANLYIYINGELANSASDGASPTMRRLVNADIGAFDAEAAGMKCFFNGLVDDVRIYDHALSEAEIRTIVPEPATLCLLMMGAVIALRQRHRT
jgi:hypothetical protein